MNIDFPFGSTNVSLSLPEDKTTLIRPTFLPPLPDIEGAIKNNIRNPIESKPLRREIKPHQTVSISICDITRAIPTSTILPILLSEIRHIPKNNISILVATGSHRASSKEELIHLVGKEIYEQYKVINHNAFKKNELTYLGDSKNGIPIYLNNIWVNSDYKISLGFTEHHFFAGYSGGNKMIAPGLAGIETILGLHSYKLIASDLSTWASFDSNPIQNEILNVSNKAPSNFSIEVNINKNNEITSIYAGDPHKSHLASIKSSEATSIQYVKNQFDIVITTNSGYPLDQNLYQCVKGISAASEIVKDNGTIICIAECRDGIPDHGYFFETLSQPIKPTQILENIKNSKTNTQDQWQTQILCKILSKAKVMIKTTGVSDNKLRLCHLEPISDLQKTINKIISEFRGSEKICALPEGPMTIPIVKSH